VFVVLGGDTGGGFLAEFDVEAERAEAGLGLELGAALG
jgi:hypothetical protein